MLKIELDNTPEKVLAPLAVLPSDVFVPDHLGGFEAGKLNETLSEINHIAETKDTYITVHVSYLFDRDLFKIQYPRLSFKHHVFDIFYKFEDYQHPPIATFDNFLCSFNGTFHMSRMLLISLLNKTGCYNNQYVSKNFAFTPELLDGYIQDQTGNRSSFYLKFFMLPADSDFYSTINSFGHNGYVHKQNIYNLESKLTQSFVHLVSETMGTNCYPMISEKFLYSIVTRSLFVAYAPPNWHANLTDYYGFKLYDKIFDYKFDKITEPIDRLIALMEMLLKFRALNKLDWHDLYHIERDTVEYNYRHYFSRGYVQSVIENYK